MSSPPETNESVTIKTTDSTITYRLEGDRLTAKGKLYLQGETIYSFPISEISLPPISLTGRHAWFKSGRRMAVWGGVAATFLPKLAISSGKQELFTIALCFALSGAVLMLLFARKIEQLTFTNRTGTALFHVIRNHRNGAEVERLISIICKAQSQSESS